MRISDWSSDVCSSDLAPAPAPARNRTRRAARPYHRRGGCGKLSADERQFRPLPPARRRCAEKGPQAGLYAACGCGAGGVDQSRLITIVPAKAGATSAFALRFRPRSEEHTSELQSLMRI